MKFTKSNVDLCRERVKGWKMVTLTKCGELFSKFAIRYSGKIETVVFFFHNDFLGPTDPFIFTTSSERQIFYKKFQKNWLIQENLSLEGGAGENWSILCLNRQMSDLKEFNSRKISTKDRNEYDLEFSEKTDEEILRELPRYYDQDYGTFKVFFEELEYLNKCGILVGNNERFECLPSEILFDSGGRVLFRTSNTGWFITKQHCLKRNLFFELKEMNFDKFKTMLRNIFDFCNLKYNYKNEDENLLLEVSDVVCFTEAFLSERKTDEIKIFMEA